MLVRAFNSGWGPSIPDERDADGIDLVNVQMRGKYWSMIGWGNNSSDQRWWTVSRTTDLVTWTGQQVFY